MMTFDKMTPERHRDLSKKGGIESGKKRKMKAAEKREVLEKFEKTALERKLIEDLPEYRRWSEMQKHKRKRKAIKETAATMSADEYFSFILNFD